MVNEGLRIIQFTAQNVKRLKLVSITPKGSVVPITGRNGQGKTSVLDAIWWALGGKDNITAVPIRKGAESGSITLDLGQFVVERTFTAKKKCGRCKGTGSHFNAETKEHERHDCEDCAGSGWIAENGSELSVRAPSAVEGQKGPKYSSPQAMLDALVGSLSFDPLEFARGSNAQQFDMLRKAVSIEFDFDGATKANAEDYKERARLNAVAKSKRATSSAITIPEGTPTDKIDTDSIDKRIRVAWEANANIGIVEAQRNSLAEQIRQRLVLKAQSITRVRNEILRLQQDLELHEKDQQAIEVERDTHTALPPVEGKQDTTALEAELQAAKVVNHNVDRLWHRNNESKDAEIAEAAAAEMTSRMEVRNKAKQDAITGAKMPVEGLGFGDGLVTFNDLPFEQASDAQRLQVSIGIAMAMNPKLRVIRIRDGSLLDEDSMNVVAYMARQGGYQFWLERVDHSGKVGIVLEDGEVVADNQVEEES